MSENGENGIADHGDVKPEINIKNEFKPDFEVKDEPEEVNGDGTGKRRRKSAKVSMAELSDSAGSEEEGPPKKKRQSAGRGRGGKKDLIDPNKSPRIVLENIDGEKGDTPSKRGRGRGRGTPGSARGGRGRGRGRGTPKAKEPSDDEDAESEEPEDDDDDAEITDESEDEWEGEKKKKKPAARAPAGRGRGRGRGGAAAKGKKKPAGDDDEEGEGEEDEEEVDMPHPNDASVNDLTGSVRTGQFMIEKNDTKHLENYPIWRMEGPNMLRKFEMFVADGKVRHKSLYAYSSWAQSMADLYTRIQVQQLSSSDGEITVEVKNDFVPKPPSLDSLQAKFSQDAILNSFQSFVTALFKQAVDSKFLANIKASGDSSYLDPINTLDTIIGDVVKKIESEVNMKEEFMTRVKSCPNMKSIKRQNWSQTDQATVDKVTEKGVRSVLMFGYGYDPFLMTEDSSRGVEVAQEIIIGATMEKYLASYHGLTHFKYNLLRRCQDKVKLEKGLASDAGDEQILANCMNDQVWILQTFEDLKTLLDV